MQQLGMMVSLNDQLSVVGTDLITLYNLNERMPWATHGDDF